MSGVGPVQGLVIQMVMGLGLTVKAPGAQGSGYIDVFAMCVRL